MKYIKSSVHGFILFEDVVGHREVANALGLTSSSIESAGFVRLDESGSIVCNGRSNSLRVGSAPSDVRRLELALRRS